MPPPCRYTTQGLASSPSGRKPAGAGLGQRDAFAARTQTLDEEVLEMTGSLPDPPAGAERPDTRRHRLEAAFVRGAHGDAEETPGGRDADAGFRLLVHLLGQELPEVTLGHAREEQRPLRNRRVARHERQDLLVEHPSCLRGHAGNRRDAPSVRALRDEAGSRADRIRQHGRAFRVQRLHPVRRARRTTETLETLADDRPGVLVLDELDAEMGRDRVARAIVRGRAETARAHDEIRVLEQVPDPRDDVLEPVADDRRTHELDAVLAQPFGEIGAVRIDDPTVQQLITDEEKRDAHVPHAARVTGRRRHFRPRPACVDTRASRRRDRRRTAGSSAPPSSPA